MGKNSGFVLLRYYRTLCYLQREGHVKRETLTERVKQRRKRHGCDESRTESEIWKYGTLEKFMQVKNLSQTFTEEANK